MSLNTSFAKSGSVFHVIITLYASNSETLLTGNHNYMHLFYTFIHCTCYTSHALNTALFESMFRAFSFDGCTPWSMALLEPYSFSSSSQQHKWNSEKADISVKCSVPQIVTISPNFAEPHTDKQKKVAQPSWSPRIIGLKWYKTVDSCWCNKDQRRNSPPPCSQGKYTLIY